MEYIINNNLFQIIIFLVYEVMFTRRDVRLFIINWWIIGNKSVRIFSPSFLNWYLLRKEDKYFPIQILSEREIISRNKEKNVLNFLFKMSLEIKCWHWL